MIEHWWGTEASSRVGAEMRRRGEAESSCGVAQLYRQELGQGDIRREPCGAAARTDMLKKCDGRVGGRRAELATFVSYSCATAACPAVSNLTGGAVDSVAEMGGGKRRDVECRAQGSFSTMSG